MDTLTSFYPLLSERRPMPWWYHPTALALTLVPFFTSHRRPVIWATYPLLAYLCLNSPSYTSGDPTLDYSFGGLFCAMLLWYTDFVVCTEADGPGAPAFWGKPHTDEPQQPKKLLQWSDTESPWQRLVWSLRLMFSVSRGIGWNWQVKNVPSDPYRSIPKWQYVRVQMFWAGFTYIRSSAMLFILGFATALEAQSRFESRLWQVFVNAAIGWSGACWVWDRLSYLYSFGAAASVALGICGTWEWPPLTGDIRDAWSVRQMWSVVYHQVLRRLLSQPAVRMARFFRLRRGSLASRYFQLYVTFAISCLYHEAEVFNVTRKDMGEFAFFISQPIAITLEDIVQWLWHKASPQSQNKLTPFSRVVGYVWVLLWFSYSLPGFLKGMRDARVMEDAIFGTAPFDIGTDLAESIVFR